MIEGVVVEGKLSASQEAAKFEITPSGFTVSFAGKSDLLSWDGLEAEFSGTDLLWLKLGGQAVAYLRLNSAVERELQSCPNSTIRDLVHERKRRRSSSRILYATGIAVLLLGAVALFRSSSSLSQSAARMVPYETERELGKALGTQLIRGEKYGDRTTKLLRELMKPLVLALPEEFQDVDIFIVKDSTLNAFALPGGVMVVHDEAIRKADTPEMLLGVIAHELSHVTERHVLSGVISTIGLYGGMTLLFGDIAGVLTVVADQAAFLARQKFSRDHEFDADTKAFDLLVRANIHPDGLIRFLELIRETNPDSDELNETLNILSTHPATNERIELLDRRVREYFQNNPKIPELSRDIWNQLKEAVSAKS